jgi:hypothetical protein
MKQPVVAELHLPTVESHEAAAELGATEGPVQERTGWVYRNSAKFDLLLCLRMHWSLDMLAPLTDARMECLRCLNATTRLRGHAARST